MAPKKVEGEFHIGNGQHLLVRSSTIVEMHDHLKLMAGDSNQITLDIED